MCMLVYPQENNLIREKTTRQALLALLLVCSSTLAMAELDEQLLGKAGGYPVQRFGSDFSLFKEEFKIGTFSHMEKVFWPRTVKTASASALPLHESPPPSISYTFEGQKLTVDDLLARQRITGLLILKDGKVILERYQYERTAAHRLASFSMAKTVVALLVGVALHEGHIASLDDSAEKYAPALKGSAWAPVTIRNLLRMSSGVKWNDKVMPGVITDGARLAGESFYQRGRGGASAVSWVKDVTYPQGSAFNYNSAESFVLGIVLRGAIKQDLATYLSEKLWKPMGAESDASWLIDSSGMEAGNCCLNATLRDYGRLGMLLANDGMWNGRALVPKDFVLDATDSERQPDYLKPRRATPYFGYGYQTWLYPYRTRTFQARGLFGQELIVQPETGVVVVITSALKTADTPGSISTERNTFLGALLTTLGGKADLYR